MNYRLRKLESSQASEDKTGIQIAYILVDHFAQWPAILSQTKFLQHPSPAAQDSELSQIWNKSSETALAIEWFRKLLLLCPCDL